MRCGSLGPMLAFTSFALLSSTIANAAAGHTSGKFDLSPTGAAIYSIPIWAPPGPNGLQPHIALTYDSQSESGPLGIGWSLSGLSSIYRCNPTYAQDGTPAPITLTIGQNGDRLCLDGKRLRITSDVLANYGAVGTSYQTEIADFSNVTASTMAKGNGPAYFTVQGRDGLTYEYGNPGTSQYSQVTLSGTAYLWLLDKVTDRAGNTMTIAYSAPGANLTGTTVPTVISWTPTSHGSTTYAYTMTFNYPAPNQPQSSTYKYLAGSAVNNSTLLQSIQIAYSGTVVKNYVLTYQTSPTTGRNELKQVQECADAGATNCLLPTTIQYQSGSAGVSSTPIVVHTPLNAPRVVTGFDFNGDGRMDLAWYASGSWYVVLSTGTGYASQINTGITDPNAMFGSVLANGVDGILARNSSTWWYYTYSSSSNSFTGQTTGLAADCSVCTLADVDGDGRPDIVGLNSDSWIHTRLNTSTGSTPSFAATSTRAYNGSGLTILALNGTGFYTGSAPKSRNFDFNGDGRADVLMSTAGAMGVAINSALVSTGSSTSGITLQSYGAYGSFWSGLGVLDWNDDGCSDIVSITYIYLSPCNGSAASTLTLPGSAVPIGAIDWDGDGRTDVLVNNGGYLGVYKSVGNGVSSTIISTSIPYSSTTLYYAIDVNGDGLADLLTVSTVSPYTIQYYPHNSAGTPPDLVSSITDGFGNSVAPTYVSLVSSTYTEYSDAAYPEQNYIGPLYVVNKVVLSDPSSGGSFNRQYAYFGAWSNLQGRSFDAFWSINQVDSREGLMDTTYYERAFPETGMIWRQDHLQSNGANEIFYTFNLPTVTSLDSTANNSRYFPYISTSTVSAYEVGGNDNGNLITTTSTSYAADNYGNFTSIIQTVTDNDAGSPYYGQSWTTTTTNTPDVDTATWCLPLLTQTQVAYTASNGSTPVTRTKSLTPDLTNCRYTQVVTEPSSPAYKVTEGLGYDSFGNVNSDTVTGIGMTARLTTANWGTTGQLPMSLTDPTHATTQFNYDFRYGLISSLTDANNETTSWAYTDGFGRLSQETRPDATLTQWSYNDCSTFGGCIYGSHALSVQRFDYNTDSSLLTTGSTYYDQVDRPLMTSVMALGGTTWNRVNEVRYDSLGRVARRAEPCAWIAVTTSCTYWTTNTYDALDRITEAQRPISSTNSNMQTTTYQYAGRTTTVTDANGGAETTTTIKDVNGWLRQTKDPYGYTVTLTYDAAGSKTGISDSAGATLLKSVSYAYGIAPFLLGATDADMGSWGYSYDALGELTGWTDAKGKPFTAIYDALSRPSSRTEPDLFTQWTWGASAASHNIGKLASMCSGPTSCTTSPGYSESDSYDSLSRLSQRAITISTSGTPTTYTFTYGYSGTTGLLSGLTYPVTTSGASLQLQYGYSGSILQTITGVISGAPNVTVWKANAANAAGQTTQETAGSGVVTNRNYDAVTHWLGSVTAGVGGGAALENQSYLYDYIGTVTQRQNNNLGLTENFYYDLDYRLTSSKLNNVLNLAIGYAANGNITSRSDVASGATWTYDPVRVHAVTQAGSSANTYTYDANGNAISRNGSTINFTNSNYPSSVSSGTETITFLYGPDRKRWQQNYNNSTEVTTYIGGLLEMIGSGGITTWRHYIYAGNEPVAVYARTSTLVNTWSYFLTDHQGSIAGITSSSGATDVNESFTAFGARRNPSTWSGAPTSGDLNTIAGLSRQGYTFQTALGQSMGLNHMNGRVEDAITGRFLSADPNVPDASNAQDYNRYSYVDNNPLTHVDPTGFASSCVGVGLDVGESILELAYGCNSDPLSQPVCSLINCEGIPTWPGIPYPYPTPPATKPPPDKQAPPAKSTQPQTQPQPCHSSGGGLISRLGSDLVGFGQSLSGYGNSTARVGADLALVSAVSSAVGVPAEPGIVVGGGMAAVGGVMSLTGSISQYVGGLMSANPSAAGAGFMGIMQNLIEGPVFAATAGRGLPGLPTGVPDPLDNMTAAASSGPGSPTCQ